MHFCIDDTVDVVAVYAAAISVAAAVTILGLQ